MTPCAQVGWEGGGAGGGATADRQAVSGCLECVRTSGGTDPTRRGGQWQACTTDKNNWHAMCTRGYGIAVHAGHGTGGQGWAGVSVQAAPLLETT